MNCLLVASGIIVGVGAAFSGPGGGFLMVPVLLLLGYSAQKAVGTSFPAILVIAASAIVAHSKFNSIDYRAAVLLGTGGIIGAQIGARLLQYITLDSFKKIFAAILIGLAVYMIFNK